MIYGICFSLLTQCITMSSFGMCQKLLHCRFANVYKVLCNLLHCLPSISLFLKLIICYISSGATNIAEVSSGFHQADWSNTLVIVYCYLISFLFCFICLLFYLFLARNLIVRICMQASGQFKFAFIDITND